MSRYARQYAAAAAAYDNASPPEDPEFGLDDAANNVADRIAERGDMGELVQDVANAAHVLSWIAANVAVPSIFGPDFRALLRQAEGLHRAVEAEYGALNGEAA